MHDSPGKTDMRIAQFEVAKLVQANPDAPYFQSAGQLIPRAMFVSLIENVTADEVEAIVMEHRKDGLQLLVGVHVKIRESRRQEWNRLMYILPRHLMLQLSSGTRRTLLMHACSTMQEALRQRYIEILSGEVANDTTARVDTTTDRIEQWYKQTMQEWSLE